MVMNIKDKIGQRIMSERKSRGWTRKKLAELSKLKFPSINNYERGDRTPGPTEIALIANALEVSPSYLMGFTDNREGKITKSKGMGGLIPVLDYKQAIDPATFAQQIKQGEDVNIEFIPVSTTVNENIGQNAFALPIKDESMLPEFRLNDVLVIDPDTSPKPGDFVVALIDGDQEVIVRKFKQLSASRDFQQFELIALNEDWGIITGKPNDKLIGVVNYLMRSIKKIL